MPFVLTPVIRTVVSGQDCLTTWPLVATTNGGSGLNIMIEDCLDWIETQLAPALAAITSNQAEILDASCGVLTQPAFTQTRILNQVGLVTATPAATLPPQLAIYVRESVTESFLIDGGGSYTGTRFIRRGGVFLPGLTEEWISEDGASVPASLASAFATVFSEYVTGFPSAGSGLSFVGCVVGTPLAALPPSPSYPTGKPARPYIYAKVSGAVVRDVSRLKSRKA